MIKSNAILFFILFFSISLYANNHVYNLGTITDNTPVTHTFSLANAFNGTVGITGIEVSCDCVSVIAYDTVLPAGGRGDVMVRVRPYGTDAFYQYVTVTTDREDGFYYTLELRGTITGTIAYEPVKQVKGEIPASLSVYRYYHSDSGYYLSYPEFKKKISGKNVFGIDIRDGTAGAVPGFESLLTIPLHQIKTKGFLRSGTVVVIGYGYENEVVEHELARLEKSGFHAVILEGGAAGLMQEKHETVRPSVYNTISADRYFAAKNFKHWMIFDITGNYDTGSLLPTARSVAAAELQNSLDETGTGDTCHDVKMLIVNSDGNDYPSLKKTATGTIFYLQGGLRAYEDFLKNQARLLDDSVDKILKQKRCASCQ